MDELIAWFESHPHLIGEGSAVNNAIRVIGAVRGVGVVEESERLSARTLIWVTDDGGEKAHNGFVYRGQNHSLAALLGLPSQA